MSSLHSLVDHTYVEIIFFVLREVSLVYLLNELSVNIAVQLESVYLAYTSVNARPEGKEVIAGIQSRISVSLPESVVKRLLQLVCNSADCSHSRIFVCVLACNRDSFNLVAPLRHIIERLHYEMVTVYCPRAKVMTPFKCENVVIV